MRFMNATQLREHLVTGTDLMNVECLDDDSFVVTPVAAGSVRQFRRPTAKGPTADAMRATFLDWADNL